MKKHKRHVSRPVFLSVLKMNEGARIVPLSQSFQTFTFYTIRITYSTYYILHILHTIHTTYYNTTYYILYILHTTHTTYYTYYIIYIIHTTHTTYYTYYILYILHILHTIYTTYYTYYILHILHTVHTTYYTYYILYALHTTHTTYYTHFPSRCLFRVTYFRISENAHWIYSHVIHVTFPQNQWNVNWIYSHVFSSIQILATDRLTKPEYHHIITLNTTLTPSQLSPILPSKSCNKLQHHKAYLHCRNPVGTTLLATSDRKINSQFKTQNMFCYWGTRLRSWLRHCAKPGNFGFRSWFESVEFFIIINLPAGRFDL